MPDAQLAGRGTIAYRWTGSGPQTVALLNGSVFNYHQWDRTALPILQRGLDGRCRFLQYDYVGIGGSSAKTAPFQMLDLADELRDLLDALSLERVHLLGISQGSLVGQAFLIRHAERAKSFCGLGNPSLLSGGSAETLAEFQERLNALEEMKDLWPQRINHENFARLFNGLYVPSLFSKPYQDLSFLEKARLFFVRRIAYPALEGAHIQTVVALFRYYVSGIGQEVPAFAEGLPQVRNVPILLLNGLADTTTPPYMSRELAQVLPGAELVEFEGVTHMGPMMRKKEAEPVFGRYVTFLQELLDSEEATPVV